MRRVAVIGSGVSGLTAAYILSRHAHVTLYEEQERLGGHAHTHTVATPAGPVRVDSGFIVHNDRTYPHLLRLFGELGIRTRDTEMSMSISDPGSGIEFAGGKGMSGFVARPRQLMSRDYLTMLGAVRRFHGVATRFLQETDDLDATTYGEFIERHRFPGPFVELYAVPLVACVWSSGRADALTYPARYLFRFLDHHGMLTVGNSPTWRTVVGGSATYVEAVAAQIATVHRGVAATRVARDEGRVRVSDSRGGAQVHDAVVLATHADQALALLADATPDEKEVLGAFRYSRNETVLHRDGSLMPQAPRARSSWNYRVAAPDDQNGPMVTYWMNRLQGLDPAAPLYVSLNARDRIDPEQVIAVMDYRHPIFDEAAVRAQRRIPEITTGTTAFAGAYQGWGFHEDGARSGVAAAAALGVTW
ncbi:MAG: FAD-dependent oxidoreductase [Phycicoccus sp.]|nr:FAD-dependent oxidoreductase [Phycicoccus sp.]